MNENTMKAGVGAVLFFTWVALVIFKVPNANDLVSCIRDALLGLGLYHIGDAVGQNRSAPTFPSSK
jgi:hypothetical protein